MNNELFLKDEYLEMLRKIFQQYCPSAEILAYGSRIKGNAHSGSDLDLAIKSLEGSESSIIELREIIRESNVPFFVDIFEFNALPQSFQEEINRKNIRIF
ncbi:MAG: nucleotidyltransferase domain-containing protein [Candidatus Gastranaerophilales bacterium]